MRTNKAYQTNISNQSVFVKKVPGKGRGVFAARDFTSGEVIEVCPVIVLTADERLILEKTILDFYTYPWKTEKDGAIVLGYGSLYNHSFEPNARVLWRYATKTLALRATRNISSGEEILVNYNGYPERKDSVDWMSEMPADRADLY